MFEKQVGAAISSILLGLQASSWAFRCVGVGGVARLVHEKVARWSHLLSSQIRCSQTYTPLIVAPV